MGNLVLRQKEHDAAQLAEAWNVPMYNIHFAQQKSNNLLAIFCVAKGLTESKLQKLYFAVSEEMLNKTGNSLPTPKKIGFSFTKWWTTSSHDAAQCAQTTLEHILRPAPVTPLEIPEHMSFARFVQDNPQWGPEHKSNFVFFRDHPRVKSKSNVLIQRMQLSGNCYLHGPIVAHYYLMCMRNEEALPIDIRTFILRHLDSEHLGKLITHCGGGSSRHIFQTLVGEKAVLIVTGFNSHQNNIQQLLDDFGPGLVTGFQIERHFQKSEQSTHSGNFLGDIIGSHSMVLIGYREEQIGSEIKKYVLLQNWWGKKQFVECDAEYFCQSGATIYFCKGEISNHSFHTSAAAYDEGNYDNDDQLPEEEN